MILEELDNMKTMNDVINTNINYLNYSTNQTQDILKNGKQSEYLGKNIRYGENVYYLTNNGALKLYPSTSVLSASQGRNNCPVNITELTEDPMSESFREKNPYVFTGTNMTTTGSGYSISGQSCGNAGSNVFAGDLSSVVTTYRGCMSSNSANSIQMENIGGSNVYTFDQCKEMATKGKYTSFSVSPSQIWYTASSILDDNKAEVMENIKAYYPNLPDPTNLFDEFQSALEYYETVGECFASNDQIVSGDETPYTSPALYTTETINVPLTQSPYINASYNYASINNTPDFAIPQGGTGYVLMANQYALIQIVIGNIAYAEWVLSNPACSGGGGVQVVNATYGANCAAQTGCSVQTDNATDNARSNVSSIGGRFNPYPSSATFTVGSYMVNGKAVPEMGINEMLGTNCSCPDKSYNISYTCGNIPKNINIPTTTSSGASVSATGQSVTLDCADNYLNCNFGIGISDLGDVKVLTGFNGSNGVSADLSCLNIPPYNGILVSNPSNLTGSVDAVQVTYNGTEYNVLVPNESSITTGNYNSLGLGQKLVSPSSTCYLSLSSSGFLTITYFIQANLSCTNNSGNWVGLMPSEGTSMVGYDGPAPPLYAVNEILNEIYSQNLGKKGYVDDNLVLHEYPANMLPTYTTSNNTYMSGTILPPPTSFTQTSVDQCQIACDGNTSCNFFDFTGTQCTYYSGGTTGTTGGTTLYTKVQPVVVNENCPFMDSTNISTSEWEYYSKGEMMSSTTPCFEDNDNYLNNEINNAAYLRNQTNANVYNQTVQTNGYLNSWQNSSTDFEKQIGKIKKIRNNINGMHGKEGFDNIATINTMFQESQNIQKRNRYRTIFWSFLAITILIMSMRVFYLYSK